MSSPCGAGVFEESVAVVQRNLAVKSLIKLDFRSWSAVPGAGSGSGGGIQDEAGVMHPSVTCRPCGSNPWLRSDFLP